MSRLIVSASALVLLLFLASTALAASPSLVLEWRVFLGEPGGPPSTPLFVGVFAGGRYAVVAGVEGANATVYVVDMNTTEVVLRDRIPGSIPLCLYTDDTGASVLVDKGGGRAEEIVVTPDLHLVQGLTYKAGVPVFLVGCARYGNYYLIYGNAVVKGRGLEAMIDLVNPSGTVLASLIWGGEGDQLIKRVVQRGDSIVALVSNLTSGQLEAYNVSFAGEPRAILWRSVQGFRLVDAYPVSNGIALLGVGYDNRTLVRVLGSGVEAPLPEGFKGIAIAGQARNYLVVEGLVPNLSTGLTDGVLVLVDLATGGAVSADVAFGKQDVSYTAGAIIGEERVLAAGRHGTTPLLASYAILWPQQVGPGNETGAPAPEEGSPAWLAPALALAVVAAGVLAGALVLRGRKG